MEDPPEEPEEESVLIVYVVEAVSLSSIPSLKALALIVIVPLFTEMGLEYTVEEDVGSEPSVVYRIVAPLVAEETVTN